MGRGCVAKDILQFLQSRGFKRIAIFSVIILILYLVRSVINIILLTFIFAYLLNGLAGIISKKLPFHLNWKILVLTLYTIFVSVLTYGAVRYFPVLVKEVTSLVKQLTDFFLGLSDAENDILRFIGKFIQEFEIADYLDLGVPYIVNSLNNISTLGIQLFIALVLSLFFLLEKQRIVSFTARFKDSKISSFYVEMEYFGKKFINTFGKVIEAQVIIATVNMFITTFFLWIFKFPNLFGLAMMVFFLGLIPVAGVVISLIPLSIIAYTVGGIIQVIYVLIMIVVVHAIEAYILNPKIMSAKTHLPVFYTFMVLIFGEHFFGVWGLILGIPIFVFILDVLGVKTIEPVKKKSIFSKGPEQTFPK